MQEMKYFNEGNDCDICKNQLMTGRDGTVEDCRRRQNGLSCRFEERDIRTCPVCEHEVDREDMYFTKDCHGIPVLSRQDDSAGKHHVELHTESQPCRKERENHMVRCNRNSVIHGLLEQYRHIRHVPAKGQALCEC